MVDLERQQARQWLEELAEALEHWRLVLVSGSHLFAGAMVWSYPGVMHRASSLTDLRGLLNGGKSSSAPESACPTSAPPLQVPVGPGGRFRSRSCRSAPIRPAAWISSWTPSSSCSATTCPTGCQATLKTEPLPTPKTEPPPTSGGRLFSEPFRLGLAGGWFGACSWFSCPVGLVGRSFVRRSCRWGCSGCSP